MLRPQSASSESFFDVRNHASEVFAFVPPTNTVSDVQHRFRDTFKTHKRLAAVFITDDGTENGRLLGLITAWDVAGIDGV